MKYGTKINIRLSNEVYALLCEIASLQDKTLTHVIRENLEHVVRQYRKSVEME